MLYFAFTSPNVIARWTDANYELILIVVVAALVIYAGVMSYAPHILTRLSRRNLLIWNALFVVALTVTLLAYRVSFPTDPSGYPLPEPLAPAWQIIPLLMLCALFPVILLDITVYSRELIARRISSRLEVST